MTGGFPVSTPSTTTVQLCLSQPVSVCSSGAARWSAADGCYTLPLSYSLSSACTLGSGVSAWMSIYLPITTRSSKATSNCQSKSAWRERETERVWEKKWEREKKSNEEKSRRGEGESWLYLSVHHHLRGSGCWLLMTCITTSCCWQTAHSIVGQLPVSLFAQHSNHSSSLQGPQTVSCVSQMDRCSHINSLSHSADILFQKQLLASSAKCRNQNKFKSKVVNIHFSGKYVTPIFSAIACAEWRSVWNIKWSHKKIEIEHK